MFVGHYGVSYAAKKLEPQLPLWLLFIAVHWLDVVWAPLILLGVEKVRIVPGFTATNPLDLYYSSNNVGPRTIWLDDAMAETRFTPQASRARTCGAGRTTACG